MSIVVSLIAIVAHMALSHVVRGRLSETDQGELLKGCLLELVAAAEMCATSYELSVVAQSYGLAVYSVSLFLIIIWRSQTWGSATACPYTLLEQYLEDGANLLHVLLKIIAQLIGGLASTKWMKYLWMMGLAETHISRTTDNCKADLQVPVILGFLIEFWLTCACCLVSRALGEIKPKFASAMDSFFATSMVLLALSYSGGYFNPVLATSLKWSCHGHTNAEHIIVYWAGSVLGSMLSIQLWNLATVKNALTRSFTHKKK
ncbi:aquaporin-11-like [Panulirus ornatus]|uniref:aquaporin-11-like n=1 Tax=Panulirus ornatus TaxID=150431 RepID=UPI003A89AEC0